MSPTDKSTTDSAAGARGNTAQPAGHPRRGWRIVGYTFGVLACLLLAGLGTVFGTFYWGSQTFRDQLPNLIAGALHGNPLANYTVEKQFPDRTTMNVLILGADKDYDDQGRLIKDANGRSDAILLARVDFVNKTISALTIPRDTAVRIPGRRGIHKINAAHAFGGPDLTIETIQSVFGVGADSWVTLNFEGFQKVVDAIGGIDLNVEKKLDYDDNWGKLHIHLKPGYQHLTGYQAMGYVRMRHSDSDLMRSQRQHNFLEAVRNKLKQPGTFMKLPQVVDTLNDSLKRGNLTEAQMFALANFARSLPKENIAIETLPSFEGPSYVTVDTEKSAQVIQRLFFPNQYVALNIDAPDPNRVRSMNAPYERGHRRRSHRSRDRRHTAIERRAPERAPDAVPNGDLSVEEPSSGTSGASDSEPPAESGNEHGSGDSGGDQTGVQDEGQHG